MTAPSDRGDEPDTSPEAQWYRQDELAARTPYDTVISPVQAVSEALAALGRQASTEDVRRHLAGRGIHVDDALIEQVRAELTQA